MRFGVCADFQVAGFLRECGYDYIEMSLANTALMDTENFQKCRRYLAEQEMKAEAFNGLFDSRIHRLTGEAANHAVIVEYAKAAMERAALLGGKVLVMGSGGARCIPEGFPRLEALKQVSALLSALGDIAESFDLEVTIEPLCKAGDNLITNAREAVEVIRMTGHPRVRLMVDIYHEYVECGSLDYLKTSEEEPIHLHISNPMTRYCPSPDDEFRYEAISVVLKEIGYEGRISVEGFWREMKEDIRQALPVLQHL